jgi:large subunit ribosomal protein L2
MALVKVNPTSPARRGVVKVVHSHLYKGEPFEPLIEAKKRTGGRNNRGRITTRHIGGGHKQQYRLVDFKRDKDNVHGTVERIEYDPNRTAHIALVLYKDGERRYIIAAAGVRVGDEVLSGPDAPIKPGNTLPLVNIPLGSTIHCVELKVGKGAQLARSAGTSMQLLGRDCGYAILKMRSGEVRKVLQSCRATMGSVSNPENNLKSFGKAGARRWLGIRPTVRGVAMNPIDHPHGGGEGKTSRGGPPRSPWGQQTKGFRTRRNKRTDGMRVRRRK